MPRIHQTTPRALRIPSEDLDLQTRRQIPFGKFELVRMNQGSALPCSSGRARRRLLGYSERLGRSFGGGSARLKEIAVGLKLKCGLELDR